MTQQYEYVFVILHYITNEDTVKCIESINNVIAADNAVGIVVVDNCSPNNRYFELKNKFRYQKNIFWLQTSDNLGFANGNNFGYSYAKDELGAQFIICINNDTEIKQKDFLNQVKCLYYEKRYDIFGPDIISIRDSGHQNPQEIGASIKFFEVLKKTVKCFLVYIKYCLPIKSSKNVKLNNENLTQQTICHNEIAFADHNIKLHGAAIVFSPTYIEKFNTAFDPRTFMYCEEDFLMWRAQLNKLKMVYSNSVVVYHKEFSSTQERYQNKTNAQLRFKHINMFYSYGKLLIAILFDRRNK